MMIITASIFAIGRSVSGHSKYLPINTVLIMFGKPGSLAADFLILALLSV